MAASAVNAITANEINRLLAAHHARDIYVAECKNGASYASKLLMLDGWAFKRTWSPLTTIGYEVKVTRADFERDQKWVQYLPLAHEFYFVCPAGLIRGVDLPPGVGLMWVTQGSRRLHTKIKSARRAPDAEQLLNLLLYVLMSRTVIVADMYEANAKRVAPEDKVADRLQQIREAVALADERKQLSYIVKDHIHRRFDEMGERVRTAQHQEERAEKFASRLAQLGIKWNPRIQEWAHDEEVRREIDQLARHVVDDRTLWMLKGFNRELGMFVETIEKLRERAAPGNEDDGHDEDGFRGSFL